MVPKNYDAGTGQGNSAGLSKWINTQRRNPSQATLLKQLGFTWPPTADGLRPPRPADEKAWAQKFALLRDFKQKHGHCEVPNRHKDLGTWVSMQRTGRKHMRAEAGAQKGKARLTLQRETALTNLGFTWTIGKTKSDTASPTMMDPAGNITRTLRRVSQCGPEEAATEVQSSQAEAATAKVADAEGTAAKRADKQTLINALELFITHVPNQDWAGHFQKLDGNNKTFLHHVIERSGGLGGDELAAVSKLGTSSIQAMLLTADKVGTRTTCTPV